MEDSPILKQKRDEIVACIRSLGIQLEHNYDEFDLTVWVIPGALGCAHRPLRHHPRYGGSRMPISGEAKPLILEWIAKIQLEGIASIISFMHGGDLDCYSSIDLGGLNLTEFLEKEGFDVVALPWEDPHHSKTDATKKQNKLSQIRAEALKAYNRLPKPVLLMCSAGIDRSAPVAAYIWYNNASTYRGA